ncbi:MAG: AI-2E family transporter, partial [Caldilineaceae bacterium]
ILNPVLLSIFMVTLSLPVYRWLGRHKIKKGIALLVLMAAILLVGAIILLLLWLSVDRLTDGLETYSMDLDAQIQATSEMLAGYGVTIGGETTSGLSKATSSALRGVVGALANVISQFGIALILAAFLIIEAPRFGHLLRTSMRDLPYIGLTPQVMQAAITYFFIRIRLNILTGLLFGVSLWLLGVDYAALWGVITVFLSFIPYIGLVIAATPATILAFAEFGAGRALLVVLVVVVINTIIENVVAPTYTGKTLSLSASVVFVSFLFWVWLLGPLGALLAMPITVLLMLTFARYEATRWLAQLISGGELPPMYSSLAGQAPTPEPAPTSTPN